MLSPGDKLGRYTILARAGSGAMGVVYRARDTRLHREVALKTLRPDALDQPERRHRFTHEALAASSLAHPNIVVIYDIGREADADFIAMEFVPGRTLDQLIGGSGLPWRDAIRHACQIAAALEAAHASGIIHRDLKPTNVIVTESGLVKVLDFGLAKLLGRTPADSTQIDTTAPTIEGSVVGTAAYMSPEQAEGRQLDARSDIFSFGSVLYEMLTGRRAFQGDSAFSTMAAILRDQTAPLPGGLPPDLARIIQGCLEKDVARRFQTMAEVRRALERLTNVHASSEGAVSLARPCAASIAVLPFASLSADKENEYFGDGLAEEIINALTKVPGLRVTARTSAFAFRGKDQDIRTIATALNVDTVLEGSVRKAGNRVRVTAQLIKSSDGYHLWSERYDRELTDIFAIQDEIAGAIVQALREHLGCNVPPPARERRLPDVAAYTALLRGRYHRFRFTPESWQLARRAFEEAVARDPEYAEAYASLATFHVTEWALDICDPRTSVAAARANALKALDLDSRRADALAVIATIRAVHDYDWSAAAHDFQRALELDPGSPEVALHYAYWFLRPRGRLHEARQYYRAMIQSDPLSAFPLFAIAESYFFEGNLNGTIEYARKALEVDPAYWPPMTLSASAHAALGNAQEALEWLHKALATAPQEINVRSIAAAARAHAGDPQPARELAAELEARTGWQRVPAMLTLLYAALGDREACFRTAEQLIEQRSARAFWIASPAYARLHEHPRYPELLRRMNLDTSVSLATASP
jgi:TolB-like protein/Tfp pilus assembly protein PilF/tRNA A-37 threonylcarbamoyl transferase component Bud32